MAEAPTARPEENGGPNAPAKVYDPASVEERIYAAWERGGYFHAEPDAPGRPFTIVIPPPNVTDRLHLGHALNNTLQDILVRWRRMQGRKTLWLPGTDHAGIATQAVVERRMFEEEKKTRHDVGREELVRRIWAWRQRSGDLILEQLRRIGCSCDWQRTRFTLDDTCARAVRAAFFKMFADGLIYRGKRLVNWDTHLQTAVADDEVYHEKVKGHLWHVRYPVKGARGRFVTVATTRPETMLGDTAVAVHPDDPRYKDLVGRTVILPLLGREIPVIADGKLVDPTFGSGCVKVTPAHDPNDYETGLRHGLEMINILTPDGHINSSGGPYAGMGRYEAREKVVADLEAQGLVEKVEDYETDIGHSDRSKTPIEPYLSDQWFVRMADLAEAAMKAVEPKDGSEPHVKFHPERYAQGYLDWLSQKRDWCISRQLWWGHRIPIWSCPACTQKNLEKAFGGRDGIAWRADETRGGFLVCAREEDLAADAIPGHLLAQDPDVLDTWFSSALWPFSTLGWPEEEKKEASDLKAFYPTDVLVTAREIITLWVARMVMMGLYCRGEVPFRDVYIHAMIQDGEGRPMKKSLGNGVDPLDIVATHGADALRFTLAYMTTETQDVRLPVQKDAATGRNTSPKFDMGRNFCNKLWNAVRFALMNLEGATDAEFDRAVAAACAQYPPSGVPGRPLVQLALQLPDRWILSRSEKILHKVEQELESFHFQGGLFLLYEFFWGDFCDWYLEAIKPRLSDPTTKVIPARVMAFVLDRALRMLHPYMPFVTEAAWEGLSAALPDRSLPGLAVLPPSKRLIVAEWPRREFRLEGEGSELIRQLANAVKVDIGPQIVKPPHSASDVQGECEVYVPLEGLIDFEAERKRLEDRIGKERAFLGGIEKKLANEKFVERAPAEVVERERARADEVRATIAALEKNLADLA
ncbi:MAG: valine--tRNA ligase [Planctomycetota bacterium]|nr:valine--tRNA ligase [Planctomycetota bacterium]